MLLDPCVASVTSAGSSSCLLGHLVLLLLSGGCQREKTKRFVLCHSPKSTHVPLSQTSLTPVFSSFRSKPLTSQLDPLWP